MKIKIYFKSYKTEIVDTDREWVSNENLRSQFDYSKTKWEKTYLANLDNREDVIRTEYL